MNGYIKEECMLEKLLKNKIVINLFFIFILSIGLNSIEAYAENASVHFGSTSYTTTEGESFPIGVYINTESGAGQYVVTVSYDPTKLQYVSGADGADTENGMLAFVGESGGPEIRYMLMDLIKLATRLCLEQEQTNLFS